MMRVNIVDQLILTIDLIVIIHWHSSLPTITMAPRFEQSETQPTEGYHDLYQRNARTA